MGNVYLFHVRLRNMKRHTDTDTEGPRNKNKRNAKYSCATRVTKEDS